MYSATDYIDDPKGGNWKMYCTCVTEYRDRIRKANVLCSTTEYTDRTREVN